MIGETVEKIIVTDLVTLPAVAPIRAAEELFSNHTCIVVRDDSRFVGLLTPKDLTRKKTLIGDCMVAKPPIHINDSIDTATRLLIESGYRALPCFGAEECFVGVVTIEHSFEYLCQSLVIDSVPVEVKNIVGEMSLEQTKVEFFGEMSHQTKNPIQVILSAMDLLLSQNLKPDQIRLIASAVRATMQLNSVISELFAKYFQDETKAAPTTAAQSSATASESDSDHS